MAMGRGAYWGQLLGKIAEHQTVTMGRSAEAPANVGFSGNVAVDGHENLRVKGANRDKSRDDELSTGRTLTEQVANSSEPACEDAVEEGSTSIQLIGPPPPLEAFLLPGMRMHFLRIGWGTKVPYKKGSKVDQETYSKLFDTNGYYKFIGKTCAEGSDEKSTAGCTHEEESVDASQCSLKRKTVETVGQLVDVHNRALLDSGVEIDGYGYKETKNGYKGIEDGGDGCGQGLAGGEQLDDFGESMREDEEGSEQLDYSVDLMTEDDESDNEATDSDVSESSETSEHDGAVMEEDGDPSQKAKRGVVKNWALVNFSDMNEKQTNNFLCKLIRKCLYIGMVTNVKSHLPIDVEKALWVMDFKLSRAFNDPEVEGNLIGLLIVILSECPCSVAKVEETCKSIGVVYQCFSSKDVRTPTEDALTKAAYEINEKVMLRLRTGVPRPVATDIPCVSEAPTIIFGADISRSTSGGGSISIASVVATRHWPGVNKYRAVVSHQPYTELSIKDLFNLENGGLIRELLLAFHQNTNQWAQRIIFFRNVEIEGQVSDTFYSEIEAVKEACASLGRDRVPVTYVVVAQRPSHETHGKGSELDGRMLFELPSCCSGQGFHTLYCVLLDDNHFTRDELISLCTSLCTPRIRWNYPKLSMVPPAYFAQVAASLARSYVEKNHGTGSETPIKLPEIRFT